MLTPNGRIRFQGENPSFQRNRLDMPGYVRSHQGTPSVLQFCDPQMALDVRCFQSFLERSCQTDIRKWTSELSFITLAHRCQLTRVVVLPFFTSLGSDTVIYCNRIGISNINRSLMPFLTSSSWKGFSNPAAVAELKCIFTVSVGRWRRASRRYCAL